MAATRRPDPGAHALSQRAQNTAAMTREVTLQWNHTRLLLSLMRPRILESHLSIEESEQPTVSEKVSSGLRVEVSRCLQITNLK